VRKVKEGWSWVLGEVALLVIVALLGWRMPFAGLGWMEAIFASLVAFLFLSFSFQGRRLGWSYLGIFLSLMGVFSWVARTIETKGGLSYPLALLGTSLFYLYEAAGLMAVLVAARWAHRRTGNPWAAGITAAFTLLVWEIHGFHIYQWGWGPTLAGIPFLARSAAFLSTYGLSALVWGCAAATASQLASGRSWRMALLPPALGLGLLGVLSGVWHLLPRGPERMLDVVMVQPNFTSGLRRPGMEEEMWALSDRMLGKGLPRAAVPTLLLWPESAVLGRNDLVPDSRHREEARKRNVAWLFGTEGGEPGWRYLSYNLMRGESPGGRSFVQAKTEPMPFGERMPGPAWMREWLDAKLGFASAVPGRLSEASVFEMTTPQGPLRIHPLICSEALIASRVQEGVSLTGADLLTNHTNDGWFDESVATDLHAVQIRLRAVEMGLPLLRSTLTGKSGVFREDGTWALWGAPMTQAGHAFTLRWRPISTPARSAWFRHGLVALLGLATLLLAWRGRPSPS
jgi:apolipoprotein N-acyltransferase